ncbi:Zinc transporter 6 [Triplophysa tibetana]|uniref:Zinc transporter 6 n=1 Tax=Triplophysa tibetana TaxID=1572043 RepID=A0A5A9P929_9TELE|nr:Zinc transporter 6 [Triplophysa tibetana]
MEFELFDVVMAKRKRVYGKVVLLTVRAEPEFKVSQANEEPITADDDPSCALCTDSAKSVAMGENLLTCLLSFWVSMKKPSQVYTFGFERFEVLAVFASTVLVQLGALFILKESVQRFVEQPEVHTGRLLVGTFVALFFNLLTLLSVKNKPFVFVSEAASTSWLQEHVADLSRSVCGLIPALSSFLLPRMNPFVLINLAGAGALGITYMLIEINNYNAMDTATAIVIALMTFGTMYPMSVYSGKVLLQTTPSHVIGQLDKLLREVSTLDGVLEVRNEHFWTVGFGSLAGSVHVRIRRDADEQMVLAHVTNRLNALVSALTVQIFKDDWSRPSLTTGSLGLSEYVTSAVFPPAVTKQLEECDPVTSTPAKPSSPPPEFSFNTPGKHVQPVVCFKYNCSGFAILPVCLQGIHLEVHYTNLVLMYPYPMNKS